MALQDYGPPLTPGDALGKELDASFSDSTGDQYSRKEDKQ